MAKLRPRCSFPISSRMNGNFCTVEMMIFLPLSINLRRSPERSAWPTVAPTWANCLMVSRICLSRMRRSVTTMMESNTPASSFLSPFETANRGGDLDAIPAMRERKIRQVNPEGHRWPRISPFGMIGTIYRVTPHSLAILFVSWDARNFKPATQMRRTRCVCRVEMRWVRLGWSFQRGSCASRIDKCDTHVAVT